FTFSQKLEDFIHCHVNMFRYFGGVPKYVVPDNCKTAVKLTDRYDPSINQSYQDMCRYYGMAVDPADPYKPRHKPNVEKSVHILQQDFLPRIRSVTFTTLKDLNNELRTWLAKKRLELMKDRGQSRAY